MPALVRRWHFWKLIPVSQARKTKHMTYSNDNTANDAVANSECTEKTVKRPTPQGFGTARKAAKKKQKERAAAEIAISIERQAEKKAALAKLLSDPDIAKAARSYGPNAFGIDMRGLSDEQRQAIAEFAMGQY